MRKVSFIVNLIGLLVIYLFACGALNVPLSSAEYWKDFLDRARKPFLELGAVSAALFVGATFLVVVASALAIGQRRRDPSAPPRLSWPSVLLAALWVNVLAITSIVVFLLVGAGSARSPSSVGALYASAVLEACVGAGLASALLFMRRPRSTFLPPLSLLMIGATALSAVLWLGSGLPLRFPWE